MKRSPPSVTTETVVLRKWRARECAPTWDKSAYWGSDVRRCWATSATKR